MSPTPQGATPAWVVCFAGVIVGAGVACFVKPLMLVQVAVGAFMVLWLAGIVFARPNKGPG